MGSVTQPRQLSSLLTVATVSSMADISDVHDVAGKTVAPAKSRGVFAAIKGTFRSPWGKPPRVMSQCSRATTVRTMIAAPNRARRKYAHSSNAENQVFPGFNATLQPRSQY
jgi:hypothetical protein